MTELLPCPFCGGAARCTFDSYAAAPLHWYVECTNGKCEALLSAGDTTRESAVARWNTRADGVRVLTDFYNEVCDQAERNMEQTNTVSGAHWNAMRQILGQMGIQAKR